MSVIYGMTGITNMAQGEFLMIGATICCFTVNYLKVPFALAVLMSVAGTAVLGVLIDRLVLKRLYNRPGDSLICTYGVSLALMQIGTIVIGTAAPSISAPFGLVELGSRSYAVYKFFLIGLSLLIFFALYMIFNRSRFGLYARATMQRRDIANSLGINVNKMNILIIVLASALGGLAGAMYAPTISVTGAYGSNFITHAFVAVIIGGANPLVGTFIAAMVLAVVESSMSYMFGAFFGRIGMLVVAIMIIRILPDGFSGLAERLSAKHLIRK